MIAATLPTRFSEVRVEGLWLLPVVVMACFLFTLSEAVGSHFGVSPSAMLHLYAFKALRVLPALLTACLIYQTILAIRDNPASPLGGLIHRCRTLISDPSMLLARVGPLLLMPLVFVGFSSLKMLMPRFVPFYLDDTFAAMDKALFFGRQPWEITHYFFGSLTATRALDFFYSLWVLLLSVAIVGFALFAPRTERARFFLAFTSAWLFLGFIGAWLLASAGPCFSSQIGAHSAPEFTGLIDRLTQASVATGGAINAPGWQGVLWRSHSNEVYFFGMGISAMPSLHNAVAALYALAAFRLGRLIGWFMTGYAVIIFVGSVHLGWHYAVDGIFGALAMIAIWRGVDYWCRRSGYDEQARA
jgi:hypothetical protein